ncbi:conserved Plasmodium protein, unknown function [Plasmodium knowlesi strain H]|uniref:Uncharacterized protein n=3 Tax=Plasmodium knowlesi TaxID=5850 RepID=A0A5K1V2L3_PLAKH|nr:conserved Plasmodium protein, unknown function [Plasmodium knowlesi strain H]OTN64827.1 Uncharacterized protein PKNOH_S120158700 [Plasmodium knowlesi]CAA9988443.1 conserved Plasmodium protein, unknown function [Plasmodium knowlesi strain H]SBO19849.1 conserved Plasmodium protein, unknown function [Plasmodium knowlesi strain H]SBO20435.1 conserved Plasmodium protein, unknown function [Plasmodium knowlesi strain H]VVS77917.1 conserved Plasmodium protein, unknown function [Plasmodium knowlesi |eukprot:XP_002259424.1 hypothetical protein, conserved in Plasmodium species [Plasmodium knowlesi strain H]
MISAGIVGIPMGEEDTKKFCIFLNFFKERVNLLQIKSRTETMVHKKNILFFILNGHTEAAHGSICRMLRNENICHMCNKLIALCNESISLVGLNPLEHENKERLKKCIRNILYCANKLSIRNTSNVRTHFINHFGKYFIEHIEEDYLLLDKNMCEVINKYTFSHKEIAQVHKNICHEMGIPANNQIDPCHCKCCSFSRNDDTLHTVQKNDIVRIVNTYSTHAETVHDNEKKKIFQDMEAQLIHKLSRTLLGKATR